MDIAWFLLDDPDIGQMWGWVVAVLQGLGIWTYIQVYLTLAIVVSAAAFLLKIIRS